MQYSKAILASLVLVTTMCLTACSSQTKKNELQIAAASSLAGAFKVVGQAFTKETGIKISLVLSSSGNLKEQIKEGAPYDVFASANLSYLEQLHQNNEVQEPVLYAVGKVVMWVRSGPPPKSLSDLAAGSYEHVAIANPEYAPYGTAAREALQEAKLWNGIKSKLVRGTNVRQAMQFVESGNAEVGLIALSLALHGGGSFTEIDPSKHHPLQQGIAVVQSSKKKKHAAAFVAFISSEKGASLLEPYGLYAARK